MSTINDLVDVANIWIENIDSNKQSWIRVINRMVPEKAVSLLEANLYLKKIETSESLTSQQKNAVHTLLNCFVSTTEYDD